jgi:hypothetical protein
MHRSVFLLGLCLLVAACGSARREVDPARVSDGSIMLRGADMSGPLLQASSHRVRNMQVSTAGSPCPRITFRGQRSATQQGDPTVYVDGTMMRDTCILQQIQSSDVEYVRIYTGGAGRPAGMDHNPFGSIVVQRIRR